MRDLQLVVRSMPLHSKTDHLLLLFRQVSLDSALTISSLVNRANYASRNPISVIPLLSVMIAAMRCRVVVRSKTSSRTSYSIDAV